MFIFAAFLLCASFERCIAKPHSLSCFAEDYLVPHVRGSLLFLDSSQIQCKYAPHRSQSKYVPKIGEIIVEKKQRKAYNTGRQLYMLELRSPAKEVSGADARPH
jgi:hypothetical protein